MNAKKQKKLFVTRKKANKVKPTQTPQQQQGYRAAKDPLVWA